MRLNNARQLGLTLVELLVAMLITAVISLAGYQALRAAAQTGESLAQYSDEVQALQRFMALSGDDLRNHIARDITTEYSTVEASISSGFNDRYIIEITRGGIYQPPTSSASSLARVAYRLEGDTVYRDLWWQLDRVDSEPSQSIPLLKGVIDFSVDFLVVQNGRVEHFDRWGVERNEGGAFSAPNAVELTLNHERHAEVKQLVIIN